MLHPYVRIRHQHLSTLQLVCKSTAKAGRVPPPEQVLEPELTSIFTMSTRLAARSQRPDLATAEVCSEEQPCREAQTTRVVILPRTLCACSSQRPTPAAPDSLALCRNTCIACCHFQRFLPQGAEHSAHHRFLRVDKVGDLGSRNSNQLF